STAPTGHRRECRAAVLLLVSGAGPTPAAADRAESCLMPLLSIKRRPPKPRTPAVPSDAPFLPRTVLDHIAPTDVELQPDAIVVESLPAAGLAVTELPRTVVPGWLRGVGAGLPFDL